MEVSDNVLARQALKRTEEQREKRRAADRLRRQLMSDEQRERLRETRRKWWRERSDKQRERKRSVEKLRREQMTNDKRGLKRERQQNLGATERGKRRIKLQCLGRGAANQATVPESIDGVNRYQVQQDLSRNKAHGATSNGMVSRGRIRLTDVKREARMIKRVCSNYLRLEARGVKPVRLSHIKREARAKTAN